MLYLRFRVIVLALFLQLLETAETQNNSDPISGSTLGAILAGNEISDLRKGNERLREKIDSLQTRIGSVENQVNNAKKEDSSASTLYALLAAMRGMTEFRPRQASRKTAAAIQSNLSDFEKELLPHLSTSPTAAPQQTTPATTTQTPSEILSILRQIASQVSAPGFGNAKWLGAFAGDTPHYVQRPSDIGEYPVFIIPESSFYQIGQPVPRHYPGYSIGYEQGYVQPPASAYPRP